MMIVLRIWRLNAALTLIAIVASLTTLLGHHVAHAAAFRGNHPPHTFQRGDEISLNFNYMTSIHTQIPKPYYSLPFCHPNDDDLLQLKLEDHDHQTIGQYLTGGNHNHNRNHIQPSPYAIRVLEEKFCSMLCQTMPLSAYQAHDLQKHILDGYHNNWIVDGLPSASYFSNNHMIFTRYSGGFPIGYENIPSSEIKYNQNGMLYGDNDNDNNNGNGVGEDVGGVCIYNHVNIILQYHRVEEQNTKTTPNTDTHTDTETKGISNDGYRVVRFFVQPISIKHSFVNGYDWDGLADEGWDMNLATCRRKNTNYGNGIDDDGNDQSSSSSSYSYPQIQHMKQPDADDDDDECQRVEVGEKIIFTYDVIWEENRNIAWSSRWDAYLTEDHATPPPLIHWYSIFNNLIVVIFLTVMIVSIVVVNLQYDGGAKYNAIQAVAAPAAVRVDAGCGGETDGENNAGKYNHKYDVDCSNTDESKEAITRKKKKNDNDVEDRNDVNEDTSGKWKIIHADVFLPPSTKPILYCVLVGSGSQLTATVLVTLILAAIGYIDPLSSSSSGRGSIVNCILISYLLCGIIAGYVSSRLNKSFHLHELTTTTAAAGASTEKTKTKGYYMYCTMCTATFFPGLCYATFVIVNIFAQYRGAVTVAMSLFDIILVAVMWCFVSTPLVFIGACFGYSAEVIRFPTTVNSTVSSAVAGAIVRRLRSHSCCRGYHWCCKCVIMVTSGIICSIVGLFEPAGFFFIIAIVIFWWRQFSFPPHQAQQQQQQQQQAYKITLFPAPHSKLLITMVGLIPFIGIFLELYFIITSLWMNFFYYMFGFALAQFVILLVASAEVTMVFVYYSLVMKEEEYDDDDDKRGSIGIGIDIDIGSKNHDAHHKNNRWWWSAFLSSGSVALYVFLYSMKWFGQLDAMNHSEFWFVSVLYFGSMFLFSLAIFLMTGCVGSIACLCFLRKIISVPSAPRSTIDY